jgi:DNA-binding IclR family transcriptional regulator
VARAFAILEVIAERDGASAREIASTLALPLPTVYRLAQELERNGYLIHLKKRQRFELGYRLHNLGVALHRQVGVPPPVRVVMNNLHQASEMASYYAVYRGTDVILAFVSDCAVHPRAQPLDFGFHEAAHATAFGKIMLAGMDPVDRERYLTARGMPRFTERTITDQDRLDEELRRVSTQGIAWESAEMLDDMACGAVAVHGPAGAIVAAVAISTTPARLRAHRAETDRLLREHAAHVSRFFRSGSARPRSSSRVTGVPGRP